MRASLWLEGFTFLFLILSNVISSDIMDGGMLSDGFQGDIGDETRAASPCVEEQVHRGRNLLVLTHKNASSFQKLRTQIDGQPVEVWLLQVNGTFTLPGTASLLTEFPCHWTNLTHITNHSQDQKQKMNAVKDHECQQPLSLKGMLVNDSKLSKICPKTENQRNFFTVMVGILIVICLVALVVHITCRKITPNTNDPFGLTPIYDSTLKRKYSLHIVHSWQDNEMVKRDLVDPLSNLGYVVAWNENAFLPGDDHEVSIERAVSNSRRMLVVASKNFITFSNGKRMIQRGLDEEHKAPGFTVVALVTSDLPKTLYRCLHEIVAKRTHVSRQCSNYIKRICNFLPSPVPSQHIITFTETDLYYFLCQQMEIIQKREKQRAHLQEVFTSPSWNPHGSPVVTSTTPQSENGVVMSCMSDDIWEAVLSRSHRKLASVYEHHHTFSNLYTLQQHKGGVEVSQVEDFHRGKKGRHSTRF